MSWLLAILQGGELWALRQSSNRGVARIDVELELPNAESPLLRLLLRRPRHMAHSPRAQEEPRAWLGNRIGHAEVEGRARDIHEQRVTRVSVAIHQRGRAARGDVG
jgi:hypothetical protein